MQIFLKPLRQSIALSLLISFLLAACSLNSPAAPQGNHQILLDKNENGLKDADDAPLLGVSVIALDENNNELERSKSDAQGYVSLSAEALQARLMLEPSDLMVQAGDGLSCISTESYSLCTVEPLADTRDIVRLDDVGLNVLQTGSFFIQSVATNFCAGVKDASQAEGATVQQFTCYENFDNQKWQLNQVGATYSMTALHSGKVMSVAGSSQAEAAKVQQASFTNAANQLWFFQEYNGTTYEIIASHSGKCLEVRFNTTVNGIALQQATCNGSDTQRFKLALVNAPDLDFPFLPDPSLSTTCAGLLQEGENDNLFGFFESKAQASASNSAFARTPDGDEPPFLIDNLFQPIVENRVEFCFNVVQSGVYSIKTWVSGLDDSDDSFWVRLNTGTPFQYLYGNITNGNTSPNPYPEFTQDFVSDRQGNDPFTVQLDAGQHYLTFYMRESGANLDRLELKLEQATNPVEPTCAGLVQEAEFGVLAGNFVTQNDASASGGQYIEAPNGSGFETTAPNLNTASYCFNVPASGTYYLSARVLAVNSGDDSFFARIDSSSIALWDVQRSTTYIQDFLSNRGGPDPVAFTLSPGQHILTIYQREDGTRLDRVELTTSLQ